jgi:hypothetical protein
MWHRITSSFTLRLQTEIPWMVRMVELMSHLFCPHSPTHVNQPKIFVKLLLPIRMENIRAHARGESRAAQHRWQMINTWNFFSLASVHCHAAVNSHYRVHPSCSPHQPILQDSVGIDCQTNLVGYFMFQVSYHTKEKSCVLSKIYVIRILANIIQ